jgi:tRNA-(ms[2]io[6]A)-hydroxylase
MFQLQTPTPARWVELVFADFDAFVLDHALCERKASALGMSLVAKYPDRPLILEPLIAFAREELEHFHIMFKVVAARGLRLPADAPDSYVNELRKAMRSEPEALLLDRLLVAGVVEARGCERLQMVTEALSEPALKATYLELTRAEARHHALFFRLAQAYFPAPQVRQRAEELFGIEAGIIARLPLRAAVH